MNHSKVAVFIDFENVAIAAQDIYGEFDFGAVIREAERWGTCIIRRAYADWTRFKGYSDDLIEHSIELTQLFPQGGGRVRKNAADIQLVVDAIETALTKPDIERFVIIGGDSDYTAVARKLRSYGKMVIGLGLQQSTSSVLVRACDEFVIYESLIGVEAGGEAGQIEDARGLLLEALRRRSVEDDPKGVLAAALKHTMLSIDKGFDEVALGFPQFKDFLEAQSDLIDSRSIDQQLWVRLAGSEDEAAEQDETAPYRAALRSADLRLLEGRVDIRTEVLQDLFRLLQDFPGEFTLPDCVVELVARYDAEGVSRDRNLVRDICKLLRFANLCEPVDVSFQFDPLSLAEDVDEDAFIDHCESVYLGIFLESHLPIDQALIAGLLYGTPETTDRIDFLTELAGGRLEAEGIAFGEQSWEWPAHMRELAELSLILDEVEACVIEEAPGVARAAALADRGHAVRPKSFEQAKQYFLEAAKMTLDLLREGRPGASQIDLETYIASYCFAAAGGHYLGYEYARASQYYLAFFGLLDEARPVWDKMYGLVPPMMSYYFSTVLRTLREPVTSSPGFTHPANMAISIYEHENAEARERWLELVADLRRVNPGALRLVADRLTQLEEDKGQEGAAETRLALAAVA